jgi:hypothetical protein
MSLPPETPQQRRERYLRHAEETETSAKRVTAQAVREHYLSLAQAWRALAADIKQDE